MSHSMCTARNCWLGNREWEPGMAHNRKVSIAPQPARIQLPSLATPPATVLEYLCERFSRVSPEIWAARINAGKVCDGKNAPITATTRYKPGIMIFYFREVEME